MKWLPCALLVPFLLVGCSPPPQVLDIGTTNAAVPQQRRVAIQRLAKQIKADPSLTRILVRWASNAKGKESDSELAYDKNSGTLTLDELRFSKVTDQAIDSVATHNENIERLMNYGAVQVLPSK